MKTFATLALGCVLALAVSAIAGTDYPERQALNRARLGVPVAGAAEEITSTTAASDATAALTADQMYVLKCDTEAYVRWCATTTCTAASGDFKLPSDVLFYFSTSRTSGVLAMAARSVAVNGSCWLLGLN